jgi:hypothetical protein
MGLLTGLGIVAPTVTSSMDDDWVVGDNLAGLAKKRTSSPIDRCTRVQLHVLLSSPQDLVSGSHDSVSSSLSSSSESACLDSSWVKALAQRCAHSGLGVNVWGIAAFEDSYGGLQDLLPLVQLTGGQVCGGEGGRECVCLCVCVCVCVCLCQSPIKLSKQTS